MTLIRRAATAAALVVASAVVVGCSDATAPQARDEPPIVYLSGGVAGSAIFAADADGLDTVRLYDADPGLHDLRPSPPGNWLLVSMLNPSGGAGWTYRLPPAGGDAQLLVGPGTHPVWSPSGTRLAWLAQLYAGSLIVLSDIYGGNHDSIALAETVAWAPDEGHLAITYRPTNLDQEIGVIDLGAPERTRTNISNRPGVDDAWPSWSPDGQWIAFWSNRDGAPGGLYVMRADGTEARQILSGFMLTPAAWSADGQLVAAFTLDEFMTKTLRIVPASGGTADTLPFPAGRIYSFDWSPRRNSLLVVAAQQAAGPVALYYVADDRRTVTMIPTPEGAEPYEAQWLGR